MKLKPCPFCGNAELNISMSSIGKAYWISCRACRAEGPVGINDKEHGVELWNNRTKEMKKTMPKRIQRKRIKGWRMPENTVYVLSLIHI